MPAAQVRRLALTPFCREWTRPSSLRGKRRSRTARLGMQGANGSGGQEERARSPGAAAKPANPCEACTPSGGGPALRTETVRCLSCVGISFAVTAISFRTHSRVAALTSAAGEE